MGGTPENPNGKDVKDPALKPGVAGEERLDYEQSGEQHDQKARYKHKCELCGELFSEEPDLVEHM